MSEESACRGRSVEAVRKRIASQTEPAPTRAPRRTAMPAPSLAELQSSFQRAIVDGDAGILDLIADNSRTARETLFGVYRHAYRARLVEILRHDYAELARFAGEETFASLALGFIAAHPSRTPNARWFGSAFPEFLAAHPGHEAHPEHADLARFARAINDAFDAADGTRLTLADLAAVPPALWGGLVFTPHPSVRRIDLTSNGVELWRWAQAEPDGSPPAVRRLAEPERLAVYRPELTPRFRALAYEEAMMFDEMAKGVAFAGLCELVGIYGGENGAALRAATHLKLWIEEGMLSGPQAD